MAPDALGLDTATFRQQLAAFAQQGLERPGSLTVAAIAGCVDLCYGFLRRTQAHLAERETEFSELVAVLSELVATLGGGATFDD